MKRLPSLPALATRLDWRLLAALGLALGLGLGLLGVRLLDSPWSLPAWCLLLAGLGWLGWDAAPRLARPLIASAAPQVRLPRLVRDGPFAMVELPGGDFLMGSPDSDDMASDDEKPQHRVRVSGFRMTRSPVTVNQYQGVMKLYREVVDATTTEGEPDRPATGVSWFDAIEFCNLLSRRHGYRPCYRESGFWRWRHWHCDWRANGYRLPTEAEWEYACRADSTTRYSFGDEVSLLNDFAWYKENSDATSDEDGTERQTNYTTQTLHQAGTKRANQWGLFDLHGNIWEWCWDWYHSYSATAQSGPVGPQDGQGRVLRGGSSVNSPELLRSACRVVSQPWGRSRNPGFRCVRVASPQP